MVVPQKFKNRFPYDVADILMCTYIKNLNQGMKGIFTLPYSL
jgi:hypothetical protein